MLGLITKNNVFFSSKVVREFGVPKAVAIIKINLLLFFLKVVAFWMQLTTPR
jgi:hypothetical protein